MPQIALVRCIPYSTPLTMLRTTVKPSTLRVLVAPCNTLHLALRMEGVQKVIRMPEVYKSGQKTLGLAQFDHQEAIIIDLHQQIYGCPNPEPERYVIVVQATGDRLFGIPVTTLPIMRAVPEASLKPLPPDYRQHDTLGIASHLITLETGPDQQTMFLLDPARMFA